MKTGRYGRIAVLLLCALLAVGVLTSCNAKEANDYAVEDTVSAGTAMPGDAGDGAPKEEMGELSTTYTTATEGVYEVKIIRTASLSAQTKEFDTAMTDLEASVAALGGYMESTDIRGRSANDQTSNRYATMTLRIPAERLDEFLTTTGERLNVISSSTSATDVSNEYYDVQARLSVLETERAVLENMLSKSTTVDNMIQIESRLYDVIYEIESYKTRLKVYDSKVSYSTVTLTLSEVTDLTVVAEGNGFGARFKKAVGDSWQSFAEFCKDAVIWLVYALPALVVLGFFFIVIPLIVLLAVRKRIKKRKQAE